MEEILVSAIAPIAIASKTGADVPDTTFDFVERSLKENIFPDPYSVSYFIDGEHGVAPNNFVFIFGVFFRKAVVSFWFVSWRLSDVPNI